MAKTEVKERRPVYTLDEANSDIFDYGGDLHNLRHTLQVILADGEPELLAGRPVEDMKLGPPGNRFAWYDPRRFEQLCDADPVVQATLAELRPQRYSAPAREAVALAIRAVYDNQYLVEIINHFVEAEPLIAKYFVAKRAWQELHKTSKTTALPALEPSTVPESHS